MVPTLGCDVVTKYQAPTLTVSSSEAEMQFGFSQGEKEP